MIAKIELLGSGAALIDLQHGRTMTLAEVRAHAAKIWPPGKAPSRLNGEEGHWGSGPCAGTFWCWATLRREYVENYMAALAAEYTEAHADACRH